MDEITKVIKKAIQDKKRTAFVFLDSNGMAVIRVNTFLAVNEEYEDGGRFIDSVVADKIVAGEIDTANYKNELHQSES